MSKFCTSMAQIRIITDNTPRMIISYVIDWIILDIVLLAIELVSDAPNKLNRLLNFLRYIAWLWGLILNSLSFMAKFVLILMSSDWLAKKLINLLELINVLYLSISIVSPSYNQERGKRGNEHYSQFLFQGYIVC